MGNGIAFCLEPALRLLPGGVRRRRRIEAALARQSRYFNAHPYLAAVRRRRPGARRARRRDRRSASSDSARRCCGPLGQRRRPARLGGLASVLLACSRWPRSGSAPVGCRRAGLPGGRTTSGTSRCGCGGCARDGREGLRRRGGARPSRAAARAGASSPGRRRWSPASAIPLAVRARRGRADARSLGDMLRWPCCRRRHGRQAAGAASKAGASRWSVLAAFVLFSVVRDGRTHGARS